MAILYLVVLITAGYAAFKLLAPEIRRSLRPKDFSQVLQPDNMISRTDRLEMMLTEKNRNIETLQAELKVLNVQAHDFDTIRAFMEAEIQRLREQNRIFRSELGLPAGQPKENPII